MTTFLLIRHAETDALGTILSGRSDTPLNAHGREQAERLAAQLQPLALDGMYSSPVARARETAVYLAERQRLKVVEDEALNEIDFGGWTGMTFEALNQRTDWSRWNNFRSLVSPPDGESMVAAQTRLVAWMSLQTVLQPETVIAAVSHSDVIKAALAHWLGVSLDQFQRMEIAPASVSVVRLKVTLCRVLCINWLGDGLGAMLN